MKRVSVVILCALAFCSCGRMTDIRLRDVETYVNDRPDSALVELEGIRPRLPWQKARHALLTSIALDKSYIDITNDSLARVALDWYDGHGPADKRMKSWYYLGLVQLNGGNHTTAIISLETARTEAVHLGDYHYLGLIDNNIADAYYKNLDAFHAIEHNLLAIDEFDRIGEKLYSDYAKISLAICYVLAMKYEKSDELLLEILKDEADSTLLVSDAAHVFASSLMARSPRNAQEAIKYYSLFRDIQKSDVASSDLFKLARAYHLTHQEDSAAACLLRAQKKMRVASDTVRYYDYYYRLAKENHSYQEANLYMEKMVEMQDSVVYQALHQSVSASLGEHFRQESLEHRYKAQRRIYLLCLTVLTMLFIVMAFLSIDGKRQKIIAQYMVSHHKLAEQLKEKEGTVVSLISGRIEIISHLLEQYEQLQERDSKEASFFDKMESSQKKVRQFQHAIEALRKDTAFMKGLEEGLDASKDRIMSRLRKAFESRLTEEDYRILTLLFAGIDGPGISYVTGVKIATVRVKKYRYRERFEKLPDGPDKALFLREID